MPGATGAHVQDLTVQYKAWWKGRTPPMEEDLFLWISALQRSSSGVAHPRARCLTPFSLPHPSRRRCFAPSTVFHTPTDGVSHPHRRCFTPSLMVFHTLTDGVSHPPIHPSHPSQPYGPPPTKIHTFSKILETTAMRTTAKEKIWAVRATAKENMPSGPANSTVWSLVHATVRFSSLSSCVCNP